MPNLTYLTKNNPFLAHPELSYRDVMHGIQNDTTIGNTFCALRAEALRALYRCLFLVDMALFFCNIDEFLSVA